MPFCLLTEPWIPLIGVSGERQNRSLMDALLSPERWQRIDGASPIETLSLYRLLLAICHRAIGPDPEPRIDLLDCWPSEKIEQYLKKWEQHFDLLHPETPFLQASALKGAGLKPSPWTRLALECSSGAARLIWDHSIDDTPEPRTYAEVARLLVAHLQFTPGGLVKALRTSAVRGPATGLMLTLPAGDTLQETLALALVPQTSSDYAVDLPAWERPPLDLNQLQQPLEEPLEGPAHRYTLLSRAILIASDGESVRWLFYAEGVKASDASSPAADPMASLVKGKKGPMPLLISDQKGFWRDFQALASSGGATAAATVRHGTALRMERGDQRPIDLLAGGLLPDQAKVILWRLEEQRVGPTVLCETKLIRAIEKALELAESTGEGLAKALYALYSEWLKGGGQNSPDPKSVRGLRDSIQASPLFWNQLDSAFWSFVGLLGKEGDPEKALSQWRSDLRDSLRTAWDQATMALGFDSRALAAAGRSNRAMAKLFSTLGQ